MRRIAYIISRAYDPGILFAILIFISLVESELGLGEKVFWIIVSEFFGFILPVTIFFYLKFAKKISDVDITNQKERRTFFFYVSLNWLILFVLIFSFQLPEVMKFISLSGFLVIAVFSLISPYFKISAHLAGATGFILFCYLILGINWMVWFGPLFILLIGWARLIQNKHTLSQMIVAVILTITIVTSVINLVE